MKLRRGFKKEANEIAVDIRKELHLQATAPLNPWCLAEYLDIPIMTLSDLKADAPFAYEHFTHHDTSAFSAVTVFNGTKRQIVHNDSHILGRQASNLAHEVSHALLLHPATPALDDTGCRNWDQEIEDEASWLAGTLLVPDEAAVMIVRKGLSIDEAATMFGTSLSMMKFRINMSGAHQRVERQKNYWIKRVKRS